MKSFIGVHSGNEILNGVGVYKNWIKKAKFLGIKNLGICEKNTLAGVIDFQKQCEENDLKSLIGLTIPIQIGNDTGDIKLYVENLTGWLNLLELNKIINIDEKLAITFDQLSQYKDGLIIIADPKTMLYGELNTEEYLMLDYYQVDTVIFENEDVDKEYMINFSKYLTSDLEPILFNDAYYLEKEDWRAREILWGVAKKFDFKTRNQYFKSNDEIAKELMLLFNVGNDSWVKLFKKSVSNLETLVKSCNFKYDTKNRRLPKYQMTEWEAERFESNEDCFIHYIKQGFKDRKVPKEKQAEYIERLKIEIDVLKKGNVLDYFLITRDFIKESHDQNILVGIGRGSAGGSLVSWLLGIIQINPIDLDLLFERFLNEGRMGQMDKCKAYKFKSETGEELILNEGTLVKIRYGNEYDDLVESIVYVEQVQEGDEILNWN